MYTEDDDNVEVKTENSNNDYDDFYTFFDEENKKEDKKQSKKKKKKEPKKEPEVKEENNYSSFYDSNDEEYKEDNGNKGRIVKICVIVFLAIALIALIVVLLVTKGGSKPNTNPGDIELTKESISLKVGEIDYISYKIVNTENDVHSKFLSSNENIVIVDEFGKITAVGSGEATVSITYTIDGTVKEKKCNITVTGDNNVDQSIKLNLKVNKGSGDKWINEDAIINVEASSVFEIDKIKYGINCSGNCEYKDIGNNSNITVSSNGTTKVKVIATDKKGQETEKEVTVKIDKEAPTVELKNKNIVSQSDIEVCVTCKDNVSGCKQKKVCKKYSESKSNQVITVYDNAGNKSNSPSFNVTINKVKPPCSLSVSNDGIVTATLRETGVKFGFDSSFSNGNELSKKVDITATVGKPIAKVVYYYVKSKDGNIGKCFITVIKECSCIDPTSTSSNCESICKFRAS